MSRGEYRSIHTVIVDDPEFQSFSPAAKLIFYTLKLQLGPTGIGTFPAAEAVLVEQTGIPSGGDGGWDGVGVADGLNELREAGWLRTERSVYWIVKGLHFDPSLSMENTNHRTSVDKHLKGLPKLEIVNQFAERYSLKLPFPDMPSGWDGVSHGDGMGDHGRRKTEDGEGNRSNDGARETPDDRLADHLNGHGAVIDEFDEVFGADAPRWASSIWGQFVSGTREQVWREVPRSDRPKLLAATMWSYIGDADEYDNRLFEGFLKRIVAEYLDTEEVPDAELSVADQKILQFRREVEGVELTG